MKKEGKYEVAFQDIVIPEWFPKPKEWEITMVADKGAGLSRQKDLIQTGGCFVDLAKIVGGLSRILPRDTLSQKTQLYKENQIEPFPGGQFLEIAICAEKGTRNEESGKIYYGDQTGNSRSGSLF